MIRIRLSEFAVHPRNQVIHSHFLSHRNPHL
jgi:hypothetical protein